MPTRDVTTRWLGDPTSAVRAADKVARANGHLRTDFDKTTKGIAARFGGMKDSLLRHSRAIGLGLAGVGFIAFKLGSDFVKAAEEAQKVGAQTNAVIESTGAVANVTAGQVEKLAESLSIKAGIDDELIQSGANVLLTFKNIRNEVGAGNDIFDQGTVAALDMSVALGTDLQGSVIQVGKALNDPIKGITALRRVGVTFTEGQVAMITKLVETGDLLGAQKVILQELTSEFGGSAEAQATASGKLTVAWDNLKEKLGTELLPMLERFSEWMIASGIPKIQEFAGWITGTLIPALGNIKTWVEKNVVPPLRSMWRVFNDDIIPVLKDIASIINGTLVPAFGFLRDAIVGTNTEAKNSGPSWAGWAVAIGAVGAALAVVIAAAAPLVTAIKGVAVVFGFMGFAATTAFNIIMRTLPFAHIIALAFIFRDQITKAFTFIRDRIVAAWNACWTTVRDFVVTTVASILRTIIGFRDTIINTFSNAISWLVEGGRNIVRGLWSGINAVWAGTVHPFFVSMGSRFAGFFTFSGRWLVGGGRNIITGLWNGIKAIWEDVKKWFRELPGKVLDILGIASPPKWAIDAGRWIMKGVAKGAGLGVGSVWDFMGGLAGKFTGPLKSAWDGISGFFASLAGNVAGFFGGGGGSSRGLVGFAAQAMTLFRNMFPGMTIGGWRSQGSVPGSDHPKGKALDLMTTNGTVAGQIIRTFLNMAGAKYWIWNRQIATAASGWKTRDYNGPSPHTDHVHLSFFKKGGMVGGRPGAAQVVVAHGGEGIFTRDQLRALGGGRRGGGMVVNIEPGAIQVNLPVDVTEERTRRLGTAVTKGFVNTLAQRRVMTDARIS